MILYILVDLLVLSLKKFLISLLNFLYNTLYMETNHFYYKKYMKYKFKYLELVNNLNSSESFNAATIIDGGAGVITKLATSKILRNTVLKQAGKIATSSKGLKIATDILSKIPELPVTEISNILEKLPIDKIQLILFNLIKKNPKIKQILHEEKNKEIKKIICDK